MQGGGGSGHNRLMETTSPPDRGAETCRGCGGSFVPEEVVLPHPVLGGEEVRFRTRVCPECAEGPPPREVPHPRASVRGI